MINGVDEKGLSKKHGNVEDFQLTWAKTEDMNQYIIPLIKMQPDYLILHVETNDVTVIPAWFEIKFWTNILLMYYKYVY